jgi:predicted nucleotidyltransferase
MKYKISSNQFSLSVLKPVLKDLNSLFGKIDVKYFVIGAIARDLSMTVYNHTSGRLTHDLDIAIAIDSWDNFMQIESLLQETGWFTKDLKQRQRFHYMGVYAIDILPFGRIMQDTDRIIWPPRGEFRMTTLGFTEVYENSMEITIDEEFTIKVASLAGLFILKLIAWVDRNTMTKKDAEDIGFILNNYLNIYMDRAMDYYENIYNDDFTELRGSAILLGKDLCEILPSGSDSRNRFVLILTNEINRSVDSRLLNQIIETNRLFKFDDLLSSINRLLDEMT